MSTIIPPPRDSLPPMPTLPSLEIPVIARRTAREALAWACCISFVLGMVGAQILLAW